MVRFSGKEAPTKEKLRGGYYTPAPVAEFLASWVAEAGPFLLEPSCGDGKILAHLARLSDPSQVTGVELMPEEAAKARCTSGADVVVQDFFAWLQQGHHAQFDGVAGNPPYIRFGSWDEAQRAPALALMRSVGMRPTKLTNAWVPFVVASVLAVRQGGRVGLVLPAELLQVGYAAALRSYLVDHCSAMTIVSFDRLVFPGILQEVVLLLAERGEGPAVIRTVEVADASELVNVDLRRSRQARGLLHEAEKWTKYYLDTRSIDALRRMRNDPRLAPLSQWAEVDVGVVSGRNSFFTMSSEQAAEQGLLELTLPLVSRSAQLSGLTYSDEDMILQEAEGARTRSSRSVMTSHL